MGAERGRGALRRLTAAAILLLAVVVPAAGRAHVSPNHTVVASGYYVVDGLPSSAFSFVATKTDTGIQGVAIAGSTVYRVKCLKISNAGGLGAHVVYARAQGASGAIYVELLDYNLDNIYVTTTRRSGPCGTGDFDRPQITGLVVTLV